MKCPHSFFRLIGGNAMTAFIRIACCTAALLVPFACVTGSAQNQLPTVFSTYETAKLADGIYAFIPAEDAGAFVSGNSVVIIGTECALVVDSGHVPSVTKKVVADIARLTNKPVRFLVNTHWHPDHVTGNSLYRDQWPSIAIVSTPATQFELTRPDSLYDDLTEMNKYIPAIEKALESGKRGDGKPLSDGERTYYSEILVEAKFMQPELQQTPKAPPTVTFDKRMVVDLGGRKVEISFLGRGNTGGDAVIYVPDAKVLITGDLLVAPTPFAIGSYIGEWIVTMKALVAIDATTIVPGHGPVEHDKQYMELVTQALEALSIQAQAAVKQGITQEQFQKSVDMAKFRTQMAGTDETRVRNFDQYFVASGAVRAYREAKEGPLKDEN
jgi:glyoxylase-like metal-dependent hydrolase (beta-lactamase superfamily II)